MSYMALHAVDRVAPDTGVLALTPTADRAGVSEQVAFLPMRNKGSPRVTIGRADRGNITEYACHCVV